MKTVVTDREFSLACCKVIGINTSKSNAPAMAVKLVTESNSIVTIEVSFEVGYGLLAEIDNALQAAK